MPGAPAGKPFLLSTLDQALPIFFWQTRYDETVGIIDHLSQQFRGYAAIHHYGIPPFFIHMITRKYSRKLFTQFDSPFGIALHVELKGIFLQVGQQEHLAPNLEDQDILPEGKGFFRLWFGETVLAQAFDIHF